MGEYRRGWAEMRGDGRRWEEEGGKGGDVRKKEEREEMGGREIKEDDTIDSSCDRD